MLNIDQLQLTPEQINLIPQYRHKWQKVALNKEPVDRDRTIIAINHLYSWLNLPHPNLIFFTSPNDAIAYLCNEIDNSWGNLESSSLGKTLAVTVLNNLLGQFRTKIKAELIQELGIRLDEGRAKSIGKQIFTDLNLVRINSIFLAHAKCFIDRSLTESSEGDELTNNLLKLFFDFNTNYIYWQNKFFSPFVSPAYDFLLKLLIPEQLINDGLLELGGAFFAGEFINKQEAKLQLPTIEPGAYFANVIVPSVATDFAYYIDYLHEVANCHRDLLKWEIFKDLIIHCGWIFPYKHTVLVCDRRS